MLEKSRYFFILCIIFLSQVQNIFAKTHYAFLIGEYLDDVTVYNDTKFAFASLKEQKKNPVIFKYEKLWHFPKEMKWGFFPTFNPFFLGKQIEKTSSPPIYESKNLKTLVEKIKLISPQKEDKFVFFIDGHGPKLTENEVLLSRKAGGLVFFQGNIISWQQLEELCFLFPDCHFFFVATICFAGGLHYLSHDNSKVSTFTLSGQLNTYTAKVREIKNFFLQNDHYTQFSNNFWKTYKKKSHKNSKNNSFLELLFFDLENYFQYPGMQISSFHFLEKNFPRKEEKTFLWKTRKEALKDKEETIDHHEIKTSSFSKNFPSDLERLTRSLAADFSKIEIKPILEEKKRSLLDKISLEIIEIRKKMKKILEYEQKVQIKYQLAKKTYKQKLGSYQERKRGSLKQSYKYSYNLSQFNNIFKDITLSFWQVFSQHPLTYLLLDELEQVTQLARSDHDEKKNKFIELLHHDLSSLEL